jgi:hypothetical protein
LDVARVSLQRSLFLSQLFNHIRSASQLRIEVLAEDVQYLHEYRIAQGVEDLITALFAADHAFGPKDSQMLGCIGLIQLELFDQLPGRKFSLSEGFHQRDSRRVRKGLEDFGFETAKRFGHG